MKTVFSPHNGILSLDENEVRLTEQAQICLAYFCENEGVLVSREALTQACWGSRNVVVTDATVRQTVSRLRKSFVDVGLSSDTLETVGKSGYRLSAGVIDLDQPIPPVLEDVQEVVSPVITEPSLTPTRLPRTLQRLRTLSRRQVLLMAAIAVLAGGVGFYLRLNQFITDINYEPATTESGHHYFFSNRITITDRASVIKRTEFWLAKAQVPPEQSQYVYINGVMSAYIVALTCSAPIESSAAACRTLTILGDNHS